jgi:hypothetical protein
MDGSVSRKEGRYADNYLLWKLRVETGGVCMLCGMSLALSYSLI